MPRLPVCIVLDTETATCRPPQHLLELGAVRLEDGRVTARFESLVRPRVPIDPGASAVHGIQEPDVREAPPAGEVLARFADWCAGASFFVAHNAPFDAAVLGFESARCGIELPALPYLDTLRLARKAYPQARNHRLTTLVAELGLAHERAHRALDDAAACAELFLGCARELGEERLAALGRSRIRAIAPGTHALPEHLAALALACVERRALLLDYGTGEEHERVNLPVLPILLFSSRGTTSLEARCGRTGLWKTYRLDRIHALRELESG